MLGRSGGDHGVEVPPFGAQPVQLLDDSIAVVREELGVTEDEDVVFGTDHPSSVRPAARSPSDDKGAEMVPTL